LRTPAFFPPRFAVAFLRFPQRRTGPNLAGEIPKRNPAIGLRSKVIVRLGAEGAMVTDDYRGYQKGVYVRL